MAKVVRYAETPGLRGKAARLKEVEREVAKA